MTSRPPGERDTVVDAKRTRLGIGATQCEPAAEEVLLGTVIGGYLVESHIGAGAMGVVYRAQHVDTNRVVALKVLHPEYASDSIAVERFRREARLAARLGHPHIGAVVELVEVDGRCLIALEFVEGEPLTSLMTAPLPADRVRLIVGQLLRGLEHAHAMELIHRDLKPDNVLVEWRNQRDHARIVDFGIAIVREGGEEAADRLTASGQVVGTPMYMAPEQAKGETIDHRADLYSLGMIMYEMLAGVPPFDGRPIEILHARLKREPPTFAERVAHLRVDPLLERFCRKLVARKPDDRFATARHALSVLGLLETDRAAAGAALGIMDVERALATIALPAPPPRR